MGHEARRNAELRALTGRATLIGGAGRPMRAVTIKAVVSEDVAVAIFTEQKKLAAHAQQLALVILSMMGESQRYEVAWPELHKMLPKSETLRQISTPRGTVFTLLPEGEDPMEREVEHAGDREEPGGVGQDQPPGGGAVDQAAGELAPEGDPGAGSTGDPRAD